MEGGALSFILTLFRFFGGWLCSIFIAALDIKGHPLSPIVFQKMILQGQIFPNCESFINMENFTFSSGLIGLTVCFICMTLTRFLSTHTATFATHSLNKQTDLIKFCIQELTACLHLIQIESTLIKVWDQCWKHPHSDCECGMSLAHDKLHAFKTVNPTGHVGVVVPLAILASLCKNHADHLL